MNIHKIHPLIFIEFIVIIFVLMFVNFRTPLVGEDLILSPWIYCNEPEDILETVSETAQRVIHQAVNWNARLGEAITIITGAYDKCLFNILNSIVTTWLIILVFLFGFGRFPKWDTPNDVFLIFFIFFLIICVNPLLGQLYFWKSGASNHTWGITILLSFTIPYWQFILNKDHIQPRSVNLVMHSLLGFVAGFTVENAVITIFILLICVVIFARKKNYHLEILPIISFAAGILTFFSVPSNVVRSEYYKNINIDGDLIGLSIYTDRFYKIFSEFIKLSWPILIVFFTLLLLNLVIFHRKYQRILEIKDGWITFKIKNSLHLNLLTTLLFSSFFSGLLLLALPFQKDQIRAFQFNWLILTSCNVYLVEKIRREIKSQKVKQFVFIGLLLFLLYTVLHIISVHNVLYSEQSLRQNQITQQISEGSKELFIPPITVFSSRIIETREEYFLNSIENFKVLYCVDTIKIINSRVNPIEYVRSPLLHYNLENVQIDGDVLKISGWAFLSGVRQTNIQTVILLKCEDCDAEYFFDSVPFERNDVRDVFPEAGLYSGFSTQIIFRDIISGNYSVGIILLSTEGSIGETTGHLISINNQDS